MMFDRIRSSVDVERMQDSTLLMVGGAYGFSADMVRCGLRKIRLVDFDRAEAHNIGRTDFFQGDLGRRKVEAVAERLLQINPQLEVETYVADYTGLSTEEHLVLEAGVDLAVYATDFFPAQARGNVAAVSHAMPAVWIGLYRGGRAGEVIHYVPGVTPACFGCIAADRYRAFREGKAAVPSEGGTILDMRIVDAVAGQIAVGILTRGADNRFGRLIDQLGNRNLLQIKLDPEYRLGTRDIFAERLGRDPAQFAFNTIALEMQPDARCQDCARKREREHKEECQRQQDLAVAREHAHGRG